MRILIRRWFLRVFPEVTDLVLSLHVLEGILMSALIDLQTSVAQSTAAADSLMALAADLKAKLAVSEASHEATAAELAALQAVLDAETAKVVAAAA